MSQIRPATKEDIDGIVAVYDRVKLHRDKLSDPHYCAYIQKHGFLTNQETRGSLFDLIGGSYEFLVSVDSGLVNGFLIADHKDKFGDDDYKTWFDPKLKSEYQNGLRVITLTTIAVDPTCIGQGIAAKLLNRLLLDLKTDGFQYLFSIVTIAPITNCPSLVWHAQNGFKRLAMGKPREKLFDLNWYASVLFYTPIV